MQDVVIVIPLYQSDLRWYEQLSLERCFEVLMDLASSPGIDGENVLWARGLPGKIAPESSGELIAKTVMRLWEENEQ